MPSLQVGPAHPHMAPDTAQLLSRNGVLLALRRDLRLPWAAWLAQQSALAASSSAAAAAAGPRAAAAKGFGAWGLADGGAADAQPLDSVRRYEVSSRLLFS